MNIMKLKIATPEYVEYFYIPEDKGEPGEIHMNIDDNEAHVTVRAEGDNSAEQYGFKAAKAVEECVKDNNIPLQFINAWG